ncbi:MAG: hypothetical protein K5842_03350 [Bacteroidales bacterium]|nr:hypothetical protein [Bacteroidales bacterium]
MKKNILLSALVCVLFATFLVIPSDMRAQAITDEIPVSFQKRIKLIDQFMSRFNGTDIPDGADKNDPQLRRKLLLSLFDHDYLMQNQQFCLSFIDNAISKKYNLQYEDSTWYAIVDCDAFYGSKAVKLTLAFRTRKDSKGLMKWVISSAVGDALQLAPSKTSSTLKISPVDNELDFIHLKDITSKNEDLIINYSDPSFNVDQTSVFFALVYSGQLRIGQVTNLSYQFDIGDYYVFVTRFNRDTTNSGWLISDIQHK